MNANVINCIDTIWPLSRIFRRGRQMDRVKAAGEAAKPQRKSSAPAMLMTSRDVRPLVMRAIERLSEWERRHKGRRQLMVLDRRALKDIGLDRAAAEEEWRKPFWR